MTHNQSMPNPGAPSPTTETDGLRLFIQVEPDQPTEGASVLVFNFTRDGQTFRFIWSAKSGLTTVADITWQEDARVIKCPFGEPGYYYTDPATGKVYVIERVDVRKLETLTDDEAKAAFPHLYSYRQEDDELRHYVAFCIKREHGIFDPWCWFAWAREASQ